MVSLSSIMRKSPARQGWSVPLTSSHTASPPPLAFLPQASWSGMMPRLPSYIVATSCVTRVSKVSSTLIGAVQFVPGLL